MASSLKLTKRNSPFGGLEALVTRLSQPTPQDRRELGNSIRSFFADNFDNEASGRGQWARLSPVTALERQMLGFQPWNPILVRTGQYARSFQSGVDHIEEFSRDADSWVFTKGSDDERAEALEFGGDNLPARPVTIPTARAGNRVLETLDRIVQRAEQELGI